MFHLFLLEIGLGELRDGKSAANARHAKHARAGMIKIISIAL